MNAFRGVKFVTAFIFCTLWQCSYEQKMFIQPRQNLSATVKAKYDTFSVQEINSVQNSTLNETNSVTHGSIGHKCICIGAVCLPLCCSQLNEAEEDVHCSEKQVYHSIDVDPKLSNKNVRFEMCQHWSYNFSQIAEDWTKSYANGSFIFKSNESYSPLSANDSGEYCFSLNKADERTDFSYKISLQIWTKQFARESQRPLYKVFGISFVLAQPFLIITIIVYLSIAKLRNVFGKQLVCYLTALSVSYFCKTYVLLSGVYPKNFHTTTYAGYLCSISCMAASFWSSALCFDLWYNLSRLSTLRSSRFSTYFVICFGIPLTFNVFMYLFQDAKVSTAIKPGLGGASYCSINILSICIITFNIVMFLLTWTAIHNVKAELKTSMDGRNSKRILKNDRHEFQLFLRLFVIMGVSWTADIVAYFAGEKYERFFYATDTLNVMQGSLIFVLFVLKRKSRILIIERFKQMFGIQMTTLTYSRTISSSVSNARQSQTGVIEVEAVIGVEEERQSIQKVNETALSRSSTGCDINKY